MIRTVSELCNLTPAKNILNMKEVHSAAVFMNHFGCPSVRKMSIIDKFLTFTISTLRHATKKNLRVYSVCITYDSQLTLLYSKSEEEGWYLKISMQAARSLPLIPNNNIQLGWHNLSWKSLLSYLGRKIENYFKY